MSCLSVLTQLEGLGARCLSKVGSFVLELLACPAGLCLFMGRWGLQELLVPMIIRVAGFYRSGVSVGCPDKSNFAAYGFSISRGA